MSLSNNFPNTSPTLMLDFINNDKLDPRITYTRDSAATYVASSGAIKLVSNNTPRFEYDPVTLESKGLLIEEDRINSLGATTLFHNSYWTKRSIGNNITHAASITAPNGTLTGTLMCDGVAADQYIRLTTATGIMANNTIYTSSIFAKKKDSNTVFNIVYAKNPSYTDFTTAVLNFNTGVVTLTVTGTVTDTSAGATQYADGWWRFWVTANSGAHGTATGIPINVSPASTSYGNGNNSVYLWGAQFEAGSFPTSYMPSVDTWVSRSSSGTYYGSDGLIKTAASGEARYQYNPQNLTAPPVLLVEASRTNSLLYSNSFGTAPWSSTAATVSANSIQTASPDGTTNATVLIEDGTTAVHHIYQAFTSVIDSTYVYSIYAKAKERNNIRIRFGSPFFGVSQYADFDVLNGVITNQSNNAKGHMVYVGNGWYRCIITTIRAVAATSHYVYIDMLNNSTASNYTGDSVSGVYIWGSQIEEGVQTQGFTVTSYIDTSAAQVTRGTDTVSTTASSRAQDVISLTGSNFSSWYNKYQGTFVWSGDYVTTDLGRQQAFKVFDTANASNRGIGVNFGGGGAGQGQFLLRNNDGTGTISTTNTPNNRIITMAGSYSNTANIIAASFFGAEATDVAGAFAYGTENKLEIGGRNAITGTSSDYNGHQRKLVYYPVKVSNAQLSNLTKTLL